MESAMLKDRVVVITGGAGLLGRTFSAAAAEHGAHVVIADVDAAAAARVVAEISARTLRAEAATLDITNRAAIDALIARLHTTHGRIDAVVNNAYPRTPAFGRPLEQVEYQDFCAHVSAHLGGYFLVAQRFAEYFKAHGGGNIVNMASIYGVIAPRFDIYAGTTMTSPVEYAAIKAGVIHLTRYFAQYFKKDGIRCNALAPGGIEDGQPKEFVTAYGDHCGTKGMLAPADVAGSLVFLLSEQSRYLTGQCLVVDDGFSL
jgi:NAD(P)-dependent dehydrogenase (short-subunit alcohol dehydrogenase family)